MGYGCTRQEDRVAASKGLIEHAEVRFEDNMDIPLGGVILAIPALLENGLIKYLDEYYKLKDGYYSIINIFTVLAFMYLLRLKSPENLRSVAPGDFGKLVGLDRVPEVKTLRSKLSELSSQEKAKAWNSELSKSWMKDYEEIGTFYVDGHIKVYNGKLTNLPAKFVSRQRLCLSGTIDYWVNDRIGQPFFVVRKPVNDGIIQTMKDEIIPELLKNVPNQPSESDFEKDDYLYRFMIIFDREGYSPEFFKELWKDRIAFCSYRKYVKDEWAREEFSLHEIELKNGEKLSMNLAERATYLGKVIWVREIRKLTDSGHQTSIISTDFISATENLALSMFSRWSQEIFFKYMMEHFGIDRLIEYGTEEMDNAIMVVNPDYRKMESRIRSLRGKIQRKSANLLEIDIDPDATEVEKINIENKQSELLLDIEKYQKKVSELKKEKKSMDKYIAFKDLREEHKFSNLIMEKKMLVDTIKMICYRSETALVTIIREHMSKKKDDARTLIRQIFETPINLKVDEENKILNVCLHNLSTYRKDKALIKLMEELNKTETIFPGTNLRISYSILSQKHPPST